MKATKKTMVFSVLALLIIFSAAFKSGQSKADFSGTWLLNKEQSDFSTIPPERAAAVSMTIVQKTDAITIERSFVGQPLNTETYPFNGKTVELTYPGKTLSGTVAGNPAKLTTPETTVRRTLAWSQDEKTINISSKYKQHQQDQEAWEYTRTETYALGADGKTLTLDRVSVTPQGTEKIKAVYHKQ